jgi:hypothetical protein
MPTCAASSKTLGGAPFAVGCGAIGLTLRVTTVGADMRQLIRLHLS